MEVAVVVLLLAVVGLLSFQLLRSSGPGAKGKAQKAQSSRHVTLHSLRPGDVVSFWVGGEKIVRSVLHCQEELGGRITRWQWVLLDDWLVEVAPDDMRLARSLEVLYQGTEAFEHLVPPTGALAVFEERVQRGEIGRNPVYFDYRGRCYRVASTGTFTATVEGEALDQEVWRDVSENAPDNVYFELAMVGMTPPGGNGSAEAAPTGEARAQSGEPELILGVWTTHILLAMSNPLDESDIKGLYGGQ